MRRGFPKWVSWLVALLVLLAVISVARSDDGRYFPSIESTHPSGARILARLLREEGLTVKSYVGMTPDRVRTDLLVSFYPAFSNNFSDNEIWTEGDVKNRLNLWMTTEDFEPSAKLTQPVKLETPAGGSLTVSASEPEQTMGEQAVFLTPEENDFVSIVASDKNVSMDVVDAIGATNQFITEHDNAIFYVNLIRQSVKKGGTVTFWERPFNNKVSPGLLASIDPFLDMAWKQFLLAFIVIIYTLGRPFGRYAFARGKQRGAKEMMVAFGDVLRRSKRADLAAELISKNLDQRVRHRLKVPADAPNSVRDQYVPPSCAQALARLESLAGGTADTKAVLSAAREASFEVDRLVKT